MKRLLAEGLRAHLADGPCFRRGEVGSRHNPEFTMLEWYRANAGVGDVMRDTEQLVAAVTGGAVHLGARRIDLHPPFERLGVCEAFERFAGWSREADARRGGPRRGPVLPRAGRPDRARVCEIDHGVLLVDYPASQASLARKKPADPQLAERFELYVAGVELCNGFGELVDPVEQRARLELDQAERRARGLPRIPSTSASSRPSPGCRRAGATPSGSIASWRWHAGRPRSQKSWRSPPTSSEANQARRWTGRSLPVASATASPRVGQMMVRTAARTSVRRPVRAKTRHWL